MSGGRADTWEPSSRSLALIERAPPEDDEIKELRSLHSKITIAKNAMEEMQLKLEHKIQATMATRAGLSAQPPV